jgi:predicted DNA-binding transcriptional regulator YafY
LVVKGNKWYVIASRNGELRNYRVSRIHHAEVRNETFTRPHKFDLGEYWEQSKVELIQKLPKYDVQVEINPEIMKK